MANRTNPLVIILCVVVGLPVLLCGGCFTLGMIGVIASPTPPATNKPASPPAKPVASTPRKKQTPPPVEKKFRRDQFFTADYLGEQFENNALKAEKDFSGVEIPVTGVVDTVSSDILGTPYVSLQVGNVGAFAVQCMFPRNMEDSLTQLQKGQTVFVVGTCQGRTIGIVLIKDCRFVQPL